MIFIGLIISLFIPAIYIRLVEKRIGTFKENLILMGESIGLIFCLFFFILFIGLSWHLVCLIFKCNMCNI